ncbi:glycosyltransferase [Pararhizobium gei]|uniref:glycosyltransferase n=1 Tax=Pararhizobium gei TaxID=1395951 RepID=UPI0023DA3246|nr:glycosyltransferase [Rhizobium gei]
MSELNSVVIGNIDSFDGRQIRGWVRREGWDMPLAVDIFIDGQLLFQSEFAGVFRADVADAGIGDGCFGFDCSIAQGYVSEGEVASVSIRLAGTDTEVLSKIFQGPFAAPADPDLTTWAGNIDGVAGRRIFGWLAVPDSLAPQTFDLFLGETRVLEGCVANLFRADVYDAGIGDGYCGFDLTVIDAPHCPDDRLQISLRAPQDGTILLQTVIDGHVFKDMYVLRLDKTDDTFIKGWFVNANRSNEVFNVDLFVDNIFYKTVSNSVSRKDLLKKGISGGLGGFSISSPIPYMGPSAHSIFFRFPDGSESAVFNIDRKTKRQRFFPSDPTFMQRGVTVIVPIYNAPEDVQICIERLLDYTPSFASILLIDDCSPDPAVGTILAKYDGTPRLRIVKNEKNLGFTRTINRGLEISGGDDVILLNSDARVTPGWLEGMVVAAMSSPRIATVTAMSDRAGAFSAPRIGNDNALPEGVDEIMYAKAFRRSSLGLYPQVPTGNGFCMYVSRAAIKALGPLDAAAFPRGYGEENDFCMRALRAGWRNIIDDRTYVFHERSKSFGEAKTDLLAAGRAVIDERYPEYKTAITVFHTDEKISLARYYGAVALKECLSREKILPRILFVVATQTGGTPQTNRDLMEALGDAAETYMLRCDSSLLELTCISHGTVEVVREHRLRQAIEPFSHRSPEYDAVVTQWLFDLDIDLLHIRHLAWHSLSLPEIGKQLGKKVIFSFHDFYTLTPTVKLLDDTGTFLGDTFFQEGSIYRDNLWPGSPLPTPRGSWVDAWRRRFAASLECCDALVTTSDSARALILEKLPTLDAERFLVIPHGRDFARFDEVRTRPVHGEPVRLLIPGNISMAKGLQVIFDLLDHDTAGLLEFHVLGKMQSSHPRIIAHGKYDRDDFARKAAMTRPHMGAVFSIWDETYCHTLTELWSIGVPAIVFDFPTLAGRVRKSGCGWVMDHHNIPALYEEILRVAFDGQEQNKVATALSDWQSGYGAANSVRVMAAHYLDLYRKLIKSQSVKIDSPATLRVGVVCEDTRFLAAGAAARPGRIGQATRNGIDRDIVYIDMTAQTLLANAKEKNIDCMVIEQNTIPRTMVNELITVSKQLKVPYVIDLARDVFDTSEGPVDTVDYMPFLEKLIGAASKVTTATEHLSKKIRSVNENVAVLAGAIDDHILRGDGVARSADSCVRAIYVNEGDNTSGLQAVLPALDLIASEHANFRLAVLGAGADYELLRDRADWVEFVPLIAGGSGAENYISYIEKRAANVDFAIMPYTAAPVTQSKAMQKLLIFAAFGLPVLASSIGIFPTDAPAVNFVESQDDEWAKALVEKIGSVQSGSIDRTAQREWVKRLHSLQGTWMDFDHLIADIVKPNGTRH